MFLSNENRLSNSRTYFVFTAVVKYLVTTRERINNNSPNRINHKSSPESEFALSIHTPKYRALIEESDQQTVTEHVDVRGNSINRTHYLYVFD